MNSPRRSRKPAMKRVPHTPEELDALVLWAFGPRVKVKFTDIDLEGRATVEATFEIDGVHIGAHNGGLINGTIVGQDRHNAFWGQGWVNGGLMQAPVAALATDELKEWLERNDSPWEART